MLARRCRWTRSMTVVLSNEVSGQITLLYLKAYTLIYHTFISEDIGFYLENKTDCYYCHTSRKPSLISIVTL